MSKMTTILRLPTSPSNANSMASRLYQSTPALLLPVIGLLMFLAIWNGVAKSIDTSLGQFPGPVQVFEQTGALIDEHIAQREKAAAFYERQEARNAARVAQDPTYEPKIRDFTGAPTFLTKYGQVYTP